jgi:DNA-binding transcriptional MerR regulator
VVSHSEASPAVTKPSRGTICLLSGYTIGQLAKAVGVPTSTIRFYERTGLFKPDGRTGGNYRHYGEQALSRLRFIRTAQATGFSLEDVRALLSLTHSDETPCDDILTLTRQRLAEVRQRIKELRHVEKVLARSLDGCCSGRSPDLCEELTRLKGPNGRPCKDSGACAGRKIPARA